MTNRLLDEVTRR